MNCEHSVRNLGLLWALFCNRKVKWRLIGKTSGKSQIKTESHQVRVKVGNKFVLAVPRASATQIKQIAHTPRSRFSSAL